MQFICAIHLEPDYQGNDTQHFGSDFVGLRNEDAEVGLAYKESMFV